MADPEVAFLDFTGTLTRSAEQIEKRN